MLSLETIEEKRKRLLELAKSSLTKAYSSDEHAVIQAINTFNELEKAKNIIHERLEEWYGVYFPELKINSQRAYAEFVEKVGREKKAADYEKLADEIGIDANATRELAMSSIGKDPSDEEYQAIRKLAEEELGIFELQDQIDSFLEKSMKLLMPNTSLIIDYKLAAELLSKAGSLEKLANMPASTIQLLGAEKALFRHIKFGSKPPKYGILFKLKEVASAKKEDKGRIARLYAAKISIAARADATTKREIAEVLKKQIEQSLQKIREHPKKPHAQAQRWQNQNWRNQNQNQNQKVNNRQRQQSNQNQNRQKRNKERH